MHPELYDRPPIPCTKCTSVGMVCLLNKPDPTANNGKGSNKKACVTCKKGACSFVQNAKSAAAAALVANDSDNAAIVSDIPAKDGRKRGAISTAAQDNKRRRVEVAPEASSSRRSSTERSAAATALVQTPATSPGSSAATSPRPTANKFWKASSPSSATTPRMLGDRSLPASIPGGEREQSWWVDERPIPSRRSLLLSTELFAISDMLSRHASNYNHRTRYTR